MVKKYVLTGSPGSGKTSTLLYLELLGEEIIREAGEDYIRLRQACGSKQPWFEKDFHEKILDLQIERENKLKDKTGRVFIDRGIADGLAYNLPESNISKRIRSSSKEYELIFFIKNQGFIETNPIRRETYAEALELEKKLFESYLSLGYKIVTINPASVEERAKTILKHLNGI